MKRRSLLAALAALPASYALPVLAQSVDATAINAYLTSFQTATGRFTQRNPNGSTQSGTFHLLKPGRIRFEYDNPRGAKVIADGTWVGVWDPKSNRNPTRYPLSKTPLSLLLRSDLSLREPGLVKGATRDDKGVHITMVDPNAPAEGRIVMTFSEDPIRLRRWAVTTRTGQTTQVALADIAIGGPVDRGLFTIYGR